MVTTCHSALLPLVSHLRYPSRRWLVSYLRLAPSSPIGHSPRVSFSISLRSLRLSPGSLFIFYFIFYLFFIFFIIFFIILFLLNILFILIFLLIFILSFLNYCSSLLTYCFSSAENDTYSSFGGNDSYIFLLRRKYLLVNSFLNIFILYSLFFILYFILFFTSLGYCSSFVGNPSHSFFLLFLIIFFLLNIFFISLFYFLIIFVSSLLNISFLLFLFLLLLLLLSSIIVSASWKWYLFLLRRKW
jgi:hypothetical protein